MSHEYHATALIMRRTEYVLEQENISIKELSERTGITVRRLQTLFNSKHAELRTEEYIAIGNALQLSLDYFTLIQDMDKSPEIQLRNAEILYKVLRMEPQQRKEFFAFLEKEFEDADA